MNAHARILPRPILWWRAPAAAVSADRDLIAKVFGAARARRRISRSIIYRPGRRPVAVVTIHRTR